MSLQKSKQWGGKPVSPSSELGSCPVFVYSLHTPERIAEVLGGGACTRNKHFSLRPDLTLKAMKSSLLSAGSVTMKVLHEHPLLYAWTHSLGVLTLGSCVSASKIMSQDEPRLPVRQSVSGSSGAGLSQTPNSQSPWSLAGA